ncbi:myotubularin-like phosphatase domain-containing protein [Ditylenchus destructor]|uniref:Myotubularin-like phosphatase domain-containing protein n=1 Tax=Ditylenchus destructor TaxID=166010 RepID=A0AAD4NJ41_9BILA|nr:myotubularin-like phosphatase domain-containing protein [Ditylenchus destructor]
MRVSDITTPKIKRVQLVDRIGSEPNIFGTVHITSSHLIFKADEGGKEIWVANSLIGAVEKSSISAAGSRLMIKCKHFLTLSLLIAKDKECQNLYESLIRCSKLVNISDSFAFVCKDLGEIKRPDSSGNWWRLDWYKEFARQGVSDAWKESNFNEGYQYCDTYPERLWIPRNASTQLLIGSCRFRSRARLPVLTYFHKSNSATITRCSQPLSGFSARCVEDENLMELISEANPSNSPLYLVDTRPRVNAMVNKVQGKGFEDVRNYTKLQFHFFDIENIHVMRNSLIRLLDACQKPLSVTDFLKSVDASGWLKHLKSLLECGKFIAESLWRGISCVIHCSDGWDRTSQTVSLAQLILDPYYRTVQGFQVLIDKDWLGFGFKFDDRCAHTANGDESAKEVSPIFTQFLDVVWQIMRKKPHDFEFNERFLLEINEHAYSCAYGTLIGNCDKDRKDLQTMKRTRSLWSYMDSRINDYINPFYRPCNSFLADIDVRSCSFVVWTAMYNRFDTGIQPREYFLDVALTMKSHMSHMEELVDNPQLLEENGSSIAVKWQSLLSADECTSCLREFMSRFDKRVHCVKCGKIYCHRCFTSDNQRICANCAK